MQMAETIESLDAVTRFVVRHTATLSGMSVAALSTLSSLDELGPTRITELAAREGVSQPAMTTMINRLERLGLATRRVDPDDGRSALIDITEAGVEMRRRRHAARTAFLAELVDRLDPAEAELLERAGPALSRLADREALPAALSAADRAGLTRDNPTVDNSPHPTHTSSTQIGNRTS